MYNNQKCINKHKFIIMHRGLFPFKTKENSDFRRRLWQEVLDSLKS